MHIVARWCSRMYYKMPDARRRSARLTRALLETFSFNLYFTPCQTCQSSVVDSIKVSMHIVARWCSRFFLSYLILSTPAPKSDIGLRDARRMGQKLSTQHHRGLVPNPFGPRFFLFSREQEQDASKKATFLKAMGPNLDLGKVFFLPS